MVAFGRPIPPRGDGVFSPSPQQKLIPFSRASEKHD
jgi:hypothetical protein